MGPSVPSAMYLIHDLLLLLQEARTLPHTLEQIAELKLFHIPKVLSRQVDIIMLDLDVGFLSDPRRLLEGTKPKFDVYVQVHHVTI